MSLYNGKVYSGTIAQLVENDELMQQLHSIDQGLPHLDGLSNDALRQKVTSALIDIQEGVNVINACLRRMKG